MDAATKQARRLQRKADRIDAQERDSIGPLFVEQASVCKARALIVQLSVAVNGDLDWCCRAVSVGHYLHRPADPRSRPLYYAVRLGGELVGCLCFGRPEASRCFRGGLTYGSQADVSSGRAAFDRWEVLNLSRVWLSPRVQNGGDLCRPGQVPGFADRKGVWRPAVASTVIRAALARVGFDYLIQHPPCFLDQPWRIKAVLSYCDLRLHRGAIYRAASFRLARRNADGIETWFTTDVAELTAEQDEQVCRQAEVSPRSQRIRALSRTLFD